MIQPTEQTRGEYGHPMWKRNAFIGLILCVIGVAMIISVAFFIYGAIVLGIGFTWTVAACLVGVWQEHGDQRRGGASGTIGRA